ncbi:MAG: OsmC family protein [Proteobacteria bacterium]|nr:OsmC family protein [Pseudomonadota bacterium]
MSQANALAQPGRVNGVDVGALFNVIKAIQADPGLARFNFRASNQWQGCEKTRTTIKDFTGARQTHRSNGPSFVVDSGEPPVLLGEDRAPNAGEYLLHTLASCITTSIAYHAAANAVEIEAIDSDLEGDVDLRGFLGLSSDVRKGFSDIRVRMRVKTDARANRIREFASMSPMLEMVSKATPVALEIETY